MTPSPLPITLPPGTLTLTIRILGMDTSSSPACGIRRVNNLGSGTSGLALEISIGFGSSKQPRFNENTPSQPDQKRPEAGHQPMAGRAHCRAGAVSANRNHLGWYPRNEKMGRLAIFSNPTRSVHL
jgi:hypothetical protein